MKFHAVSFPSMNLRFYFVSSIVLFLATFLVAWSFLAFRVLPWWTDGGLWLKYANGLIGIWWPLWDEEPLNYPPLFPSILALLTYLTKDPLFSIKFMAAFVFSLRPVAAFLSSILIFRDRLVAVVAALIMVLLPIHVEMLGWGGYPNLLSSSLLMIFIGLMVSWLRGNLGKLIPLLFITSALIALGHNLTFLVYVTTLGITLVSLLLLRRGVAALKVLSILSFALGIYLFYVFVFLWPPKYLLYNEAAYHHLKVTLSSGFLTWIFKSGGFLLTLYFLTAVTISSTILLRKMLLEVGVLVVWLITPLLIVNVHILGIALDYQRIFLFFVDPFILLAAFSFQLLSNATRSNGDLAIARLREWFSWIPRPSLINILKILLHLSLIFGVIVAVSSSIIYGYSTFKSVNSWYNFKDKYGDLEKLEALEWIKHNTPADSTIVAEEEIARWIEGYSSRKVLMYAHPMYLFVEGEHQRAYDAKTILLSSICLTNGNVASYEPHDPRGNISTRIAVWARGALEEIFFLESNSSYVEGYYGTKAFREYLSDAKSVEVHTGDNSIKVAYIFEWFVIEKYLSINPENNQAIIVFKTRYTNSDAVLDKLVVELRKWPTRTIWEVRVKPNGTLLLTTDIGKITVETNSITAFPFVFDTHQEAVIMLSSSEKTSTIGEVRLIHSKNLLKHYNAKYIVVPRLQETQASRNIQLKPFTRAEYMHLLDDPSYQIVYENDRVIILEFLDVDEYEKKFRSA